MRYKTLIILTLNAAFLYSCKTPPNSNISPQNHLIFNNENKIPTYSSYYIIDYGKTGYNNYTEKQVVQIDSINIIRNEFQNLLNELTIEKNDPEIDTISNYKLQFISESYKNDQLQGIGTQNNVLRKCGQKLRLRDFIKFSPPIKSYSKKYLIVYSFPIVDVGDTYVRTFKSEYYFEKIVTSK
ncbi:MAG: hypothetical protein EOP00_02670 [Pedobacter sp.]|nr:MAG: hypothetical protein EOP00_02670 [Pedobacter sp.]